MVANDDMLSALEPNLVFTCDPNRAKIYSVRDGNKVFYLTPRKEIKLEQVQGLSQLGELTECQDELKAYFKSYDGGS